MKKALFILYTLLFFITCFCSCNYDRAYFHNKHGHIRHGRAIRYEPWYNSGRSGYSKHARRVMRGWERRYP